jgi:hypothetical protein
MFKFLGFLSIIGGVFGFIYMYFCTFQEASDLLVFLSIDIFGSLILSAIFFKLSDLEQKKSIKSNVNNKN